MSPAHCAPFLLQIIMSRMFGCPAACRPRRQPRGTNLAQSYDGWFPVLQAEALDALHNAPRGAVQRNASDEAHLGSLEPQWVQAPQGEEDHAWLNLGLIYMGKEVCLCSEVRSRRRTTARKPGNTFSAQNRKATERFMIFDPKKGGVIPPPPPHLPQILTKVGFKWGGSGGVRTKNSLGDAFIGQNNDLTRG